MMIEMSEIGDLPITFIEVDGPDASHIAKKLKTAIEDVTGFSKAHGFGVPSPFANLGNLTASGVHEVFLRPLTKEFAKQAVEKLEIKDRVFVTLYAQQLIPVKLG